jgi:hypothetical protein
MGFRGAVLVLIVLICMASQGMAQDTYQTSPIVEDVKDSF